MDYRNTLNLPKTNFPMKAELPKNEPKTLRFWEDIGIYNKIRQRRQGSAKYILHDGPPYANGNIHIGHALNKTLKDIVVRFKTMRGFDAPFVPGWDCHGMPIEHQLFKELNKDKRDIERVEFRKLAHRFAMKFVDIQREEFNRLGIFGDWEEPYLTLNPEYEAKVIESFLKLMEEGYIYRGLKPINWCAKCETALAEAEVEYETHRSPSIYVKFNLEPSAISHQPSALLVWTTTPWTLLSNVAVAIHPNLQYAVVRSDGGTFILAEELIGRSLGIKKLEVVARIKGKDLEGKSTRHPFLKRDSKIILADFVSNQEGTGCVHIAPGHGQEDYVVGLKYSLPVIMPVDERGRFKGSSEGFEIPEEFVGKDVFEANEIVVKRLRENNALLRYEETEHSYPHCWRCKEPLIFRATRQYFFGVDQNGLRQKTLAEIKKVRWVPEVGERRISSMIELRPDWCLSRQRYWGVPIPVFYCTDCEEPLQDKAVWSHIVEIVKKEGSDAWFRKSEIELLPGEVKCHKCGGNSFRKEQDILDVWFESGASHQGVLFTRKELNFPSDLYLEGSDQHRGWFQTSILVAMGTSGTSPFKSVLTHGFVVDGEGKKMSKSAGNVIAPQEIISKYGSDVLRLWVASCSYFDDVRLSYEILERVTDTYRKIRNTIRFLLGNLYDFEPQRNALPYEELLEIDKWALSRLNRVLKLVTESYEEFEYHRVVLGLYNFCVVELSNFYLDILKDRLYTFWSGSEGRRSAQTVLCKILEVFIRIVAPILPFTSEEIWQSFKKDGSSVHLTDWPEIEDKYFDENLELRWARLIQIREAVLKEIETKRTEGLIGSSLEAKVRLLIKDKEEFSFLKGYLGQLPAIFIVSEVLLEESEARGIEVAHADGSKCQRCWNWTRFVGKDSIHPGLCERCIDVMHRLEVIR